MSEVFSVYSKYTGSGILMILFFVSIIYVGLKDKNRSNVSMLFFGSIALVLLIMVPFVHGFYVKHVDPTTYWRFWWTVPIAIGLSYVGALLFEKHRETGLVLSLVVLILGGRFVYTTQWNFKPAENPYKLPQEVIEVADFLGEVEEEQVFAAVCPALLEDIRQYDEDIILAFGREQLDPSWHGYDEVISPFFEQMMSATPDFEALQISCMITDTEYIVFPAGLRYLNHPGEYGFTLLTNTGTYEIFHFEK